MNNNPKHRRFFLPVLAAVLLFSMMLAGCGSKASEQPVLQDGYYTAQASDYVFGWKEYITIQVQSGEIVAVEYNAENASHFIKSWDNSYMQIMLASDGTYPNEYTRNYAAQLLQNQGFAGCDAISGATSSFHSFEILVAAVLERAYAGDTSIALVDANPY